jgi:DNA-binding LytR/AlgR family response regulator
MSSLRCLIVDDEPVARKIIREYIDDVDFLELAGEAENPAQTTAYLTGDAIDLIFLDVQMPGMNGIDFLKTVHPSTMTVMTTAFPEYALEGFDLDVLDYLVKPIAFERFLKAVQKARDYHLMKTSFQEGGASQDGFFIKCEGKIEKILIQEILYVKAMANYVILHTAQRKYVAYMTLKGLGEKLPAGLFVRIHKSYLVSLQAIDQIKNNMAVLGNMNLPVSKHYRHDALEKINQVLFKR